MKMTGNAILITGGGTGIGRGLAEAFLRKGNRVIVAGRSRAPLEALAAAHADVKALTVDMRDPGSIAALAAQAVQIFPDLNVLINNAGMMQTENLLDPASLAQAEATIATNLLGPIRLTLALLPHLTRQAEAAVLNTTSGLAFVPLAMAPTYCATKAALHSWGQSLRFQLRDTSVAVHEIAPPYVQTALGGEWQASDPAAMPLADFIEETMRGLEQNPDAHEILVERVLPLRDAEKSGGYEAFFTQFNSRMAAVLQGAD
jgi:uncharacterized oxidoreductase